jgi:hypothetical protein
MATFQEGVLQLFSIIGNVSQLLVSLAAIAGIIGYWKWRVELVGKTKFDIARKILNLAYESRKEVLVARNIITSSYESRDRQKAEGEDREIAQILDEFYARQKRLKRLDEINQELFQCEWEAEVFLNHDISTMVQLLQNKIRELPISQNILFNQRLRYAKMTPERRHGSFEAMTKEMADNDERNENIVYGTEGDEFDKSLSIIVASLTDHLKKFVR